MTTDRRQPPDPELERLRAGMDALNERLVAVLQDRARLCRAIAAHKRARGLPAADPAREAAMLSTMLARAGDGFAPAELESLLRTVFAASRRLVETTMRG